MRALLSPEIVQAVAVKGLTEQLGRVRFALSWRLWLTMQRGVTELFGLRN